uniref:Mu-type opioid receptor n=1 Tax=Pyxicephalus adspersus TaxID=30357 RepID=A0AAV3AK56_PYXAD|nr:TPA: hypothetical protein GDO54_011078 [Pyxicephalus adspersus]
MDIALNSSLPPADILLNSTTGALGGNATLSAMRCPFGVLGNMTRLDGNQSFLCNGPDIPPEDTNSIIIAIIITALYSMICVVGLFGNVLVMYVIVSLGSTDCGLVFPHPSWYWDNLLKICVFIFAFIMPVLIITVCYGMMILRLKSVRMLSGSKEKDRNLRRITRMVLVVVAVFIVCWTPIHIYVIIKALINIPSSLFQTVTWHVCIALGYTNSCLNPVLYAFLDENFKRCFREFCIPTTSTIEQQNSTRMRHNTRDHVSTANTVDRTNHQV